VGHLLSTLLPMCIASAVSPVMLTEQTVVLGLAGRRGAAAYALGTAVVLAAVAAGVLLVGRSLQLPTAPHLTAQTDVGLGVLLIVGAVALTRLPRRPPRPPRQHATSLPASFGFGAFSMATNFTTLALVVAMLKDVSASGPGAAGVAVAILAVLLFGCLPAWLPLGITLFAPARGEQALRAFAGFVNRHGWLIALGLTAAVGVYLFVRGLVHLT
jgi:Sap, sulfolipid-1-addressing protein